MIVYKKVTIMMRMVADGVLDLNWKDVEIKENKKECTVTAKE